MKENNLFVGIAAQLYVRLYFEIPLIFQQISSAAYQRQDTLSDYQVYHVTINPAVCLPFAFKLLQYVLLYQKQGFSF